MNATSSATEKDLGVVAVVRERMGHHGWGGETSSVTPFMLGELWVESATGMKRGTAHLSRWSKDASYSISGEFYSEGRNICAPVMAVFYENADHDLIRSEVDRFCAEYRELVDESYAVRLFRRRGNSEESAGPR